jgi:hypothetical protein
LRNEAQEPSVKIEAMKQAGMLRPSRIEVGLHAVPEVLVDRDD